MCNLHWQIIFQQPAPLTYGCQCVHDVSIVVANFLCSKWDTKHVTIKQFEVFDICNATMVQ
jgi:hypothetical protein